MSGITSGGGGGGQPLDSDLTTIAALTPTTDNFMVAAASAWASRTPAQAKTALSLVKGDVGLGNVDNTSDVNKPISTATQTALNSLTASLLADGDKGDITVSAVGTVFTIDNSAVSNAKMANMTTKTYKGRTAGTTGAPEDVAVATLKTDLGLVKGDVGLGNVDNTSDANKPVSTATQTALDLKQPLDSDLTTIAGLTATSDNFMVAASSAWASRTPTQAKTSLSLGNVDNTSDASKPVSTATQTALDLKQPLDSDLTTIAGLTATTDNFMVSASNAWASRTPTQAKTSLSLGNVDNTSDANKPISSATQTALDAKQATLVSATNIKTINGGSVLGSGDLTVSGSAAETNPNLYVTTADYNLTANRSIVFVDEYEIGSGFVTDLAADAIMAIN